MNCFKNKLKIFLLLIISVETYTIDYIPKTWQQAQSDRFHSNRQKIDNKKNIKDDNNDNLEENNAVNCYKSKKISLKKSKIEVSLYEEIKDDCSTALPYIAFVTIVCVFRL